MRITEQMWENLEKVLEAGVRRDLISDEEADEIEEIFTFVSDGRF